MVIPVQALPLSRHAELSCRARPLPTATAAVEIQKEGRDGLLHPADSYQQMNEAMEVGRHMGQDEVMKGRVRGRRGGAESGPRCLPPSPPVPTALLLPTALLPLPQPGDLYAQPTAATHNGSRPSGFKAPLTHVVATPCYR